MSDEWILTDGSLAGDNPMLIVAHVPAEPGLTVCGVPGVAQALPTAGRFLVCPRCLDALEER